LVGLTFRKGLPAEETLYPWALLTPIITQGNPWPRGMGRGCLSGGKLGNTKGWPWHRVGQVQAPWFGGGHGRGLQVPGNRKRPKPFLWTYGFTLNQGIKGLEGTLLMFPGTWPFPLKGRARQPGWGRTNVPGSIPLGPLYTGPGADNNVGLHQLGGHRNPMRERRKIRSKAFGSHNSY